MLEAITAGDEVECPRCRTGFDITPELFGAVVECPECSAEFTIKPVIAAGGEEGQADKTARSGIKVNDELTANTYRATGTVRLGSAMSMLQELRQEGLEPPPPPEKVEELIEVVATKTHVTCPHCEAEHEITQEFYGAVAECSECTGEFLIKAPKLPRKPTQRIKRRDAEEKQPPPAPDDKIEEPANDGEEPEPVVEEEPADAPAKSGKAMAIWIVVGVLVLLGLAAGLVALLR